MIAVATYVPLIVYDQLNTFYKIIILQLTYQQLLYVYTIPFYYFEWTICGSKANLSMHVLNLPLLSAVNRTAFLPFSSCLLHLNIFAFDWISYQHTPILFSLILETILSWARSPCQLFLDFFLPFIAKHFKSHLHTLSVFFLLLFSTKWIPMNLWFL